MLTVTCQSVRSCDTRLVFESLDPPVAILCHSQIISFSPFLEELVNLQKSELDGLDSSIKEITLPIVVCRRALRGWLNSLYRCADNSSELEPFWIQNSACDVVADLIKLEKYFHTAICADMILTILESSSAPLYETDVIPWLAEMNAFGNLDGFLTAQIASFGRVSFSFFGSAFSPEKTRDRIVMLVGKFESAGFRPCARVGQLTQDIVNQMCASARTTERKAELRQWLVDKQAIAGNNDVVLLLLIFLPAPDETKKAWEKRSKGYTSGMCFDEPEPKIVPARIVEWPSESEEKKSVDEPPTKRVRSI